MALNFDLARHNMVEQQVRTWEILDPAVLATFEAVHREEYVPKQYRKLAFTDMCLPLCCDELMNKPIIDGRILECINLQTGEQVLEVGTGSGFLTACMSHLGAQVTSVEIHEELMQKARKNLKQEGFDQVKLILADAMSDWQPVSQYDVVVLTGAINHTTPNIFSWVKPEGRLFVIEGQSPAMQARLYQRNSEGKWEHQVLFETDIPYLHNIQNKQRFKL